MSKLDELIEAKDELSSRLLRSDKPASVVALTAARSIKDARKIAGRNLHAIGVGRKFVGGKKTGTLCIRLYVLQKQAINAIRSPARLPGSIAGLPTDVIESPLALFHCSVNRRARQRPIVGGISAASDSVGYSATFGCMCRSAKVFEFRRRFILGCNHSFANLGGVPRGAPILQPSLADGGGTSADGDRIARFERAAPIVLGLYGANRVDAAIAALGDNVLAKPGICTIGQLRGTTQATLGMIVCKHGRTTGFTEGEVVDISLDAFVVDYVGGIQAVFVNQYRIEPTLGYNAPPDEIAYDGAFAAPGDSGSVVVKKGSRRAVALHFAGAYGISIANPILEVCRALRITIP